AADPTAVGGAGAFEYSPGDWSAQPLDRGGPDNAAAADARRDRRGAGAVSRAAAAGVLRELGLLDGADSGSGARPAIRRLALRRAARPLPGAGRACRGSLATPTRGSPRLRRLGPRPRHDRRASEQLDGSACVRGG